MPAPLVIPAIRDQEAFNLDRWDDLCADPALAKLDFRIETDRHGKIIMTPPPGFAHGAYQAKIALELSRISQPGKPVTECPVSTSAGVKAADVAWISEERLGQSRNRNVLTIAPEICVEVLSPSNTRDEIDEKKRLYFEAGACEVWICDLEGRLFFYLAASPGDASASKLLPNCANPLAS